MLIRSARVFLIVPMFALLALNSLSAETRPKLDPKLGLDACAALVDQQLESVLGGLRMLSVTDEAASGEWDRLRGPLAQFAKGVPTSAAVWFAAPDGTYFTIEAGRTDQNLKDRDYFPALMTGKEVAGDLVISKSTGKRTAIVAVPVQKEGHVVGALGASLAMERVATFVDDQVPFPKRVIFYALDQKGQVALHRESELLFEFAAQLGSPTLAEAVKEMLSKPEGEVHYQFQGAERTAIFKKSAVTGWVYALRW